MIGRNGTVYLYLATDREGEAIAWHLRELLGGSEERFRRVTFSEITPAAVQAAFERPRGIDYDLVHAQQARRFLRRSRSPSTMWRPAGPGCTGCWMPSTES